LGTPRGAVGRPSNLVLYPNNNRNISCPESPPGGIIGYAGGSNPKRLYLFARNYKIILKKAKTARKNTKTKTQNPSIALHHTLSLSSPSSLRSNFYSVWALFEELVLSRRAYTDPHHPRCSPTVLHLHVRATCEIRRRKRPARGGEEVKSYRVSGVPQAVC
jgi:hypothetical protein